MSHALVVAARRVLRWPGPAMLASLHAGTPEASLVTVAVLPDLSPVLLLSRLARHTRALHQAAACGLVLVGTLPPPGQLANPQTVARVALRGRAAPDPDPDLRRRFLALHPYAAAYADFTDFGVYRVGIEAADIVLGFGRAASLTPAQLLAGAVPVADFLRREAAAIATLPYSARLAAAARLFADPAAARLVAIDPDGADWIGDGRRARLAWAEPLPDPALLTRWLPGGSHQPCDISPLA